MDLVSFDELKDLLHLKRDSIDEYEGLKVINDTCKASFESFLGRYLEDDMYTEYFDAEDYYNDFPVQGLPVRQIKEITVDGEVVNASARIRTDGIVLNISQGLVGIKYMGGPDEIPEDIKRAALLQIAYEYQGHENVGATSVSTDGGTVRKPALGLLPEVKRLLAKHINYNKKGA